jgi:lysyl-tRNA synthetase class 2
VRPNLVRALVTLTVLVAIAVLVGAFAPAWAGKPLVSLAGIAHDGRIGTQAALALGLTLLLLARGLSGGRRLARQLLAALVLAGLAAPVLAGAAPTASFAHRPGRWVVGVAAVGALGLVRHEFPAIPHPRRLRAAVRLAAAGLGVAVIHTVWLVIVGPESLAASARPSALAAGIAGAPGLLATGCALVALAVALAPAPAPIPSTPAERARVAALVADPQADSLAPFATRADKTFEFSPDGRAAIGYRVILGVALAGGDPVGASTAADAAIAAFLQTCSRNGWRPAVVGAGTPFIDRWRAQGLRRRVVIGDEAVLEVASFTLQSRVMRNVRQAVRRTHNAGLTVHIGQLHAVHAKRLEPVVRDWLDGRHERGFSMNLDWLLRPRTDCLVAIAYDKAGVAQGFARFGICAAGRTLTLDVAPRRRDAPNGVVERLIVDVVEYGRANGVTEVSLNFAGFRGMYARTGAAARTVAALAHLLDRWVELGPLYRFNAKFDPRWRARSVVVRSWLELAWVGPAALRAELGRPRIVPALDENPELDPAIAWSTPSARGSARSR